MYIMQSDFLNLKSIEYIRRTILGKGCNFNLIGYLKLEMQLVLKILIDLCFKNKNKNQQFKIIKRHT